MERTIVPWTVFFMIGLGGGWLDAVQTLTTLVGQYQAARLYNEKWIIAQCYQVGSGGAQHIVWDGMHGATLSPPVGQYDRASTGYLCPVPLDPIFDMINLY